MPRFRRQDGVQSEQFNQRRSDGDHRRRNYAMNQLDQYSQVQTYKLSQAVIKAPAARIWPHLLDFSSFNDTFEKIEVLVGEPNAVGTISRLTKKQGPFWIPPYLVKIVHIEVNRTVVWKMYPEQGDDATAFVDFSLTEVEGGTLFAIRNYKENRVSIRSLSQQIAYSSQTNEAAGKLHYEVSIPNLKKLVE